MNLAIGKEEQAILWSELERVPELYREALVLYYREHRSVEHVAAALDLTEDAVKQRLARGRKILQERVLAFVEGALTRSTPGRVFTLGVLAVLPEMATPVKAAGIGAAAAHGGMMAKTTSIGAMLASITGVVNLVMALRISRVQSRTPRERRAVARAALGFFGGTLAVIGALYLLRAASFRWWDQRVTFAILAQLTTILFMVVYPPAILRMLRHLRRVRSAERRDHPERFTDAVDQMESSAGEYRSRARLFGVPLLHFRFALAEEGSGPVFGWIAAGDRAYGILFAWGTWAVGTISVGAFSLGLISVGGMGLGLVGLGTFVAGWLAVGCVSVGVKAFAWLSALGWEMAQSGGFAIARVAAEAPVAVARHANDPIAREILANPHAERNQMIFFIVIVVFSLVPLFYYARAVQRRLGHRSVG